MRTIRAVYRAGNLEPIDPIDLPENTHLTVALLDSDDLSAEGISELSDNGGVFDFLNDPREDLYTETDGEAV